MTDIALPLSVLGVLESLILVYVYRRAQYIMQTDSDILDFV
jgi:hypothetical protein